MKELIPIFICAVMPVCIVLIVFMTKMNSDKKRAETMQKAIESGALSPEQIENLLKDRGEAKTPRQKLARRLLAGCIFTLVGLVLILYYCFMHSADDDMLIPAGLSMAVGISYLIVFFVTRRQIESEEKSDREK